MIWLVETGDLVKLGANLSHDALMNQCNAETA